MSNQRKPASELLPLMAAAFPRTFFTEPEQVQPLKINIHHDLLAALPDGIKPYQAGRFLYWYVSRAAYQRALLQGKGRLDLTGAVVESDIPAAIREQARERWQQLSDCQTERQVCQPDWNPPVGPTCPAGGDGTGPPDQSGGVIRDGR